MSRNTGLVVALIAVGLVGLAIVAGVVLLGLGAFLWVGVRHEAAVAHDEAARATLVGRERATEAAEAQRLVPVPAADETEAGPPREVPAPPADGPAAPLAERRRQAIARGVDFLLRTQAEDGSWARGSVGITALGADALLATGKTAADLPVRRAVEYLLKAQKPDGGIYDDGGLKIYSTSISLGVLVDADPKAHADAIEKAKAFLIQNQWDEGESIDRANPWYGGQGYGKSERPDLSNTQYFVEAMHRANLPKDHPLWAKVVVFVSRNQDRSESNDGTFVGTDSGGMVYSPHKGGESKAGTVDLPDGRKGLKAYGSMTYAGFKSFVYADLKRDDPRVQAALDWVRKHWTFEENPELGQEGLFYYYQTAAKALKAWGENDIRDARRRTHDWRTELSEAILRRQQADGSWFNETDRWFEGKEIAQVPTSYCLIALKQCE